MTGGKNQCLSLTNVENQKTYWTQKSITPAAVCVMTLAKKSSNILAVGDEEGIVKLWDIRTQKEISSFDDHDDFSSQLLFSSDGKKLLSAG